MAISRSIQVDMLKKENLVKETFVELDSLCLNKQKLKIVVYHFYKPLIIGGIDYGMGNFLVSSLISVDGKKVNKGISYISMVGGGFKKVDTISDRDVLLIAKQHLFSSDSVRLIQKSYKRIIL